MNAIITSITGVFTAIADWISTTLPSITEIFYTPGTGETPGSLTFLGVLAVVALGISIFFLLMGLVQNFLHFRG